VTAVPDRPCVGVGAVLIHEGRVLLVRRGKEPLRGRWVVPGGTVELGETLEQALVREVEEETGLIAEAVALVAPADLPAYDLPEKALEVVQDGFRRAGHPTGTPLALGAQRE
jgi:ADP-ribose pyrophosphatase YjhB (NUDIX family)